MDFSISSRTRSLAFYDTLLKALPARSASDRTCFRRIAAWLAAGVEDGRFTEEVFPIVLSYANEATAPGVRNPAAVFVTILKKELGYDPASMHRK